jgi:hypothetical protein
MVDLTHSPHLLRYTWVGPAPTPEQAATLRITMAQAGHLTAETGVLVDMQELTTLPTLSELRAIVFRARTDGMTPRAVAFLARTPEQFGVSRQNEMLLPSEVTAAVFTDEDEARAWLMESR